MTTVAELGERGVLKRVLAQLGEAKTATVGPGDDCAVLEPAGKTVVTSDTMIEGADFRLDWHNGFQLGWKLAATNLSDIAAMGATPSALTVSFACPADTPVELLSEISRGLDAACRTLAPGCGVVGGDLGRAPVLFAAVTALGNLGERPPVLRSNSRPGDVIAYAGDLGLAGLGLSLLFTHCAETSGATPGEDVAVLKASHPVELAAQLAPSSPIHLGVLAADGGATAMMDVSDGLALDAWRMGEASGVRLNLSERLLADGFGEQRGVHVPVAAMLEGGEDHGLLACFPGGTTLPGGFTEIGLVEALPASGTASDNSFVALSGEPYEPGGWDPYRPSVG